MCIALARYSSSRVVDRAFADADVAEDAGGVSTWTTLSMISLPLSARLSGGMAAGEACAASFDKDEIAVAVPAAAATAELDAAMATSAPLLTGRPTPIRSSFQLPPSHHPNPPTTLSSTRRLITHPTTSRKRKNAERIKSRSYQSARSMALTSAEDVSRMDV